MRATGKESETMSNIVETRTYVDGDMRIRVLVKDNGCVSFQGGTERGVDWTEVGALGADVLRQLADLAERYRVGD
jgi:hypothetical protein